MNYIRISNESFFDKDYNSTFRDNVDKYKFFNIANDLSTLIPMYKDLLRLVIGEKVNEEFRDFALSNEQIEQIKTIFSEQIDIHLPKMETKLPYDQFIEWKGKKYEMNLRLHSPINRRIWDFYSILQIANECLNKSKPMYLSID